MKKSNSIIWFEWFSNDKKGAFERETRSIWSLSLRNGIAPTVFKKWLREEICKEVEDDEIDKAEIQSREALWVKQKQISAEKFAANRSLILEKCRMTEENLAIYCMNEAKAIKWAQKIWSKSIEQIYLETKDRYDEVKLQMITLPVIEKGLTLEVYQQLKEGEIDISCVGEISSAVKYQSEPLGTWYQRINLRKEIFQTINRLKSGELSAPFKVSNNYTIINFCETRGTELSELIKGRIISEQMAGFIDYGVEQLLDHVCKKSRGKQRC